MQPGYAYPLPVRDITELDGGTGSPIATRDKQGRLTSGTKSLAWYYHETAQPLALAALRAISKNRANLARSGFKRIAAVINKAMDDRRAFAECWQRGYRDTDDAGARLGLVGAIAAVRELYEDIVDPDQRIDLEWDAVRFGVPEGAVPIVGELAVVRYTGEIVTSHAEKQRLEHEASQGYRPPRESERAQGVNVNYVMTMQGGEVVERGEVGGPA